MAEAFRGVCAKHEVEARGEALLKLLELPGSLLPAEGVVSQAAARAFLSESLGEFAEPEFGEVGSLLVLLPHAPFLEVEELVVGGGVEVFLGAKHGWIINKLCLQ